MKTDQEVVNSYVALRIVSGMFALGGAIAIVWSGFRMFGSSSDISGLEVISLLGTLYGMYLFGFFAFKGKLPLALRNSGKA